MWWHEVLAPLLLCRYHLPMCISGHMLEGPQVWPLSVRFLWVYQDSVKCVTPVKPNPSVRPSSILVSMEILVFKCTNYRGLHAYCCDHFLICSINTWTNLLKYFYITWKNTYFYNFLKTNDVKCKVFYGLWGKKCPQKKIWSLC